jgi:fluoroquinolone resistance protein
MNTIFEDELFEKEDIELFSHPVQFTNCIFKNIDFSEQELNGSEFIECRFESCNFSMSKLDECMLNDIHFSDCKLLGVDFGKCSKFLFSVSFKHCLLNYVLFFKNDLKKTTFINCEIKEASFIECNLTSSFFDNCNLEDTSFEQNNLENANLSTARNYRIDPLVNRIKKASFSLPDVVGLLYQFDIDIH